MRPPQFLVRILFAAAALYIILRFTLYGRSGLNFRALLNADNSSSGAIPSKDLYAILASDSNPVYIFPLPIVVLAYMRLGVQSIVLLIGTEKEYLKKKKLQLVLTLLRETTTQLIFLQSKKVPSSALAQTSRLFVTGLPELLVPDDADLLISDADMITFTLKDHLPQRGKNMFLYNSKCCGLQQRPGEKSKYRQFGMQNILMKVYLWRQVMNISKDSVVNGDVITNRLYSEFGETFMARKGRKGSSFWYMDQVLISSNINAWLSVSKKNSEQFDEFAGPIKRIDRPKWNSYNFKNISINDYHDSHVLHPLYEGKNWKKTIPLFEMLFEKKILTRLLRYQKDFVNTT